MVVDMTKGVVATLWLQGGERMSCRILMMAIKDPRVALTTEGVTDWKRSRYE